MKCNISKFDTVNVEAFYFIVHGGSFDLVFRFAEIKIPGQNNFVFLQIKIFPQNAAYGSEYLMRKRNKCNDLPNGNALRINRGPGKKNNDEYAGGNNKKVNNRPID